MNHPTIAECVREAREKAQATAAASVAESDLEKATFKAVKVDEQGVITMCSASIAKDKDDETVQKAALIGLAYDFCAMDARVFHANHDKAAKIEAQLVESCVGVPVLKSGKILEPGAEIPADDPFDHVRTMDASKAYNTHWFVSVRPTDPEIVKAAKEGKIVGSSWGGMCLKGTE